MKLWRVWLCLFLCGILFSCKGLKEKPSVIIITLDTVRQDHLSLYGYFRKTTPFLEKLGAESVVFENAYTPISHTVPAHTSLFSSRYPSEHRVLYNGWRVESRELLLLAEVLKRNGYQTGAVLGSRVLDRYHGLNRGFRFYQDQDFERKIITMKKSGKKGEFIQRRAEDVVKWSVRWLNEIDPEKPFFLWAHFYDAHHPYDLPPEYPAPFQLDQGLTDYLKQNQYLIPDKYENVNTYDNELSYLDQNLEKFFHYLKAQGLLEKTLIIITSDHGEGLGQHNLMGHGLYLYQDQVRIPLLIRFPDLYMAGTKIKTPVSLIDIAPTVLEYLRIKDPMKPSGSSLLGLVSGEKKGLRACEFFERRWYEPSPRVKGRKAGALCGNWKVIWADEEDSELYDLSQDPLELRNLREQEKKKFLELEAVVKEYQKQVNFFSVKKQKVPEEVLKRLKAMGYVQ